MKQIVRFAFGVLLAGLLSACAAPASSSPAASLAAVPSTASPSPIPARLQPGDHIGQMTVEKGAIAATPWVADGSHCSPNVVDQHQPGTQTLECRVQWKPDLNITYTWGAKDLATLDATWQAQKYNLSVDGNDVNLGAFGWEDIDQTLQSGARIKSRQWSIHLSHLATGRHTLRWAWRADAPVNDGFAVYAPGTYELVVNFTVEEAAKG